MAFNSCSFIFLTYLADGEVILPRDDFRVTQEAYCYASESELNVEAYFLAAEFEIRAKTARVILVFIVCIL